MTSTGKKVAAPARWAAIRLLASDVDGVLTDGGVIVSSDGTEAKVFNVLDGFGLARLRDAGVTIALISGRASRATALRAAELRLPIVHQGVGDKAAVLAGVMAELGLPREAVCYIGDDVNDLGALALAGIACAPPNALPPVLAAVEHVTDRAGGRGAVRELCDSILEARGTRADR